MRAALLAFILGVSSIAQAQGNNAPAPVLLPFSEMSIQALKNQHKGKVLVLNFWATWCKPCLEEFPELLKLRTRYAGRGVEVAFVSVDDDARAKQKVTAFLRKQGVTFTSYIKQTENDEAFINSIAEAWSGALPARFIYDRNGVLEHSLIEETNFDALESLIKPLL